MTRSLETMQKLFADKGYNLLSEEYYSNKQTLVFEKDGYYFTNTYNGFMKTDNPKKWGKNNKYSLQNLQKYLKDTGATCEVISTEYDYNNIQLKCECGNIYNVVMNNLLYKEQYTCPKCGIKRRAAAHAKTDYLDTFEKNGLKIIGEYISVKNYVLCETKEGYKVRTSEFTLRNQGFPLLFHTSNPYTLNNIKLWMKLNDLPCTLIAKEYENAKARMDFRCECGEIYQNTFDILQRGIGLRCPKCARKMSSLERKTKEWLDQNNIAYIHQFRFDDCRDINPLPFDFYLPDFNLCIECQGQQHYIDDHYFSRDLNYVKRHDEIKKNYCISHNIKYLDIKYILYRTDTYKRILSENIPIKD